MFPSLERKTQKGPWLVGVLGKETHVSPELNRLMCGAVQLSTPNGTLPRLFFGGETSSRKRAVGSVMQSSEKVWLVGGFPGVLGQQGTNGNLLIHLLL